MISDFTPPRRAAGMEAETPPLTGSDHALPCRCRDWGRDGLCGSQAKRLPSWPGPSASGWRPFFFPLLPLPVESRQRPLIAGIACNGAALHVSCVVRHVTPQRQNARRPTFPPGVIFSRSIPMRQDDRPFWQEVREELSPRRNPIGWACVLAILGMFCLVGYFDHPAELHMRPAIIVSK